MKSKLNQIITASAAAMLACAALAQTPDDVEATNANLDSDPSSRTVEPDPTPAPIQDRRTERRPAERLNGAIKASELLGMTVKNYQDEKLGKVEDLAVDVESGRVVQVILSTGGFAGLGDTLTAVPPSVLHHDAARKILHLNADKAKLKGAPKFVAANWAQPTQADQVTEVYHYYGTRPYFTGQRDLTTRELAADRLPRNMDGTINTDGPRTVERVRNREIAREAEATTDTIATRNADGSWDRQRYAHGRTGSYSAPSEPLGQTQQASKLIGTSVQNLQGEKLGNVENILVDLTSSRIVAVIISSGGFIGLGDELSAIPPTALQLATDRKSLQLDASKEVLSQGPHFKSNQWPDFNEAGYAAGVYRAYQVEPYFASDAPIETDSTRRSVRDRIAPELTPLDQGNNKADIATTAQIRKEIIAAKNLSVNAQNVKIITRNGQITLRGMVNTVEEKRRIGQIAERSQHSGSVANQLEVQAGPNPQ